MKSVNTIVSLRHSVYMAMISLLSLLGPINAPALEWRNGDWQVHGFLSQRFTYTDHNQVFGTSDDGSLDFREMGLNSSVKLLPNLLVSAQGLYRDAGASDDMGTRQDFAHNFLLAADYHYINGTAWLNTTDNPDLLSGVGDSDWNLFTTILSFRF